MYKKCQEHFGLVTQHTVFEGVNIGIWAQAQREQYKAGKLLPERIRLLNDIGFVWRPNDGLHKQKRRMLWEEKYALYKECFSLYGHVYGSTEYKGILIGEWVTRQKEAYKAGKLTEEQQRLLLLVDPHLFDRRPAKRHKQPKQPKNRDQEWNEKFLLYMEYTELYGRVPKGTTYKGVQLSTWVQTQKEAYKEKTISEERKMRLLELDPHFFDGKRRES